MPQAPGGPPGLSLLQFPSVVSPTCPGVAACLVESVCCLGQAVLTLSEALLPTGVASPGPGCSCWEHEHPQMNGDLCLRILPEVLSSPGSHVLGPLGGLLPWGPAGPPKGCLCSPPLDSDTSATVFCATPCASTQCG